MRPETAIVLAVLLMAALAGLFIYFQSADRTVEENGSISVVMCPECEQAFVGAVQPGMQCALYDVGSEVGAVLEGSDVLVITDDESKPAYGQPYRRSGLMHHKFCVAGDLLLTGSYNPTDKGELNRNNLLLIRSATLASNYRSELQYLRSGERGRVRHSVIVNGTLVENYFCPADSCEEKVLAALGKANSSIRFMTYSFTSDPIGELLLSKREAGVLVEGVCDGGQLNDYNECERLGALEYARPELLHHKVFIIDGRIVITGSYNPTASGNERNNENVLIIHNNDIAREFLEEYHRVRNRTTQG